VLDATTDPDARDVLIDDEAQPLRRAHRDSLRKPSDTEKLF
jgi:hypothetical protein